MNLEEPIDRRTFFRITGTVAGGLLIALSFDGCRSEGNAEEAAKKSFSPSFFLEISPDATVTIWSKNPEMGQGVKTSFPRIIAEELGADWSRVRIVQADYNPQAYGSQDAGGSASIRDNWRRLRQAGAAGREMLLAAAAQAWSVEKSTCIAENGTVIHPPSGRKLGFGQLVEAASRLPVPTDVKFKDSVDYRLLGKPAAGVDNLGIVTGSVRYGLDARVPGMLHAVIEKSPVFGGKVVRIDDSKAKAVPGVRQIVRIEGLDNPTLLVSGVAVVADSTWAAMQGRKALQVQWDGQGGEAESTESLRKQFQELAGRPGKVLRQDGDPEGTLAQSAKTLSADYEVPFLAHAALEPVNCVADIRKDGGELWGPFQNPGPARESAAQVTGLPESAIKVHMTRIGGGFGRRLLSDFAPEAALISKAVGAPVQVVWTREDDLRHDYYRPAGFHRLQAGIDDRGRLTAWTHHLVNTSRYAFRKDSSPPESSEVFEDDFPAGLVPNFRLAYTLAKSRIPTGPWRATLHSANAFAVQRFLDEVAHAAGRDPLELMLQLLGESRDLPFRQYGGPTFSTGRMRAVLERAAEKAGWGKPLPPGRGRGIASNFTFGSYAAHVAEVSVERGQVQVHRLVVAVDCGTIVNPSGVEAQTFGATLDGLSAALQGEITVEQGRTVQGNFHQYPLLRLNEAPPVEVLLVESGKSPTGMGEIALPPVAPAVANAVFAATGHRIRRLPFRSHDFTAAPMV